MSGFLNFIYEVLKQFFISIFNIFKYGFSSLFDAFNIVYYIKLFDYYKSDFNVLGYILGIITLITMFSIMIVLIYLLYLLVRKIIRLLKKNINNEKLISEIGKLNHEVIKLSKEKDKLLQLKVDKLGVDTFDSDSRFYKLKAIDREFLDYDRKTEVFDNNIDLKELCINFRNYCLTNLGLYYDSKTIRLFISALGVSKLLIFQGISGTGKTSLPYAFGKFINNNAYIASVQPSWRDKNEIIGYFNEFTKKYNETEILKVLYEATYTDKIYIIVLDEMNIARVEYYFAEMLSVLEVANSNDRVIEITSDSWENDPVHLSKGKLKVPDNVWFVGTANNDESTFAISDKVYDRAIVLNINTKGKKFTAPETDSHSLSNDYLNKLFCNAKEEYNFSSDLRNKLLKIDDFLINKFQVSFGNRILSQLEIFLPIYIACGGTEIEAIDYFLFSKIFFKLESANLNFYKKELDELNRLIKQLFPKEDLIECCKYIKLLKLRY